MRLVLACALVLGAAGAAAQEDPGSISGTLVDVTDAAIANVTVTILSPITMETLSDATGRSVIAGLAPATYKVRVRPRGFKVRELEVLVESGKERSLGRLVLDVASLGPCIEKAKRPRISEKKVPAGVKPRLSGTARGETGVALIDLTLSLLKAGTSKAIASASTGENGEFQFVDVSPGVYDLEVFSEGFKLTKISSLRVRSDHELELRLTWTQPQLCL
jgi:hypothetical protein